MTPEQFKNIWNKNEDSLSPLSIDRFGGMNLLPETINFLTIAGLPFEAAPFLSFVQDRDDSIRKLTDEFDFLDIKYEKYLIIGSSGNGDIIVINSEKNDQIELLDHEKNFSSRFFNRSLCALAECLIIYKNFILTILEENVEDAYLDSNFSDSQFAKLQSDLSYADTQAIIEGFWKEQLELELINRQYYRNLNNC